MRDGGGSCSEKPEMNVFYTSREETVRGGGLQHVPRAEEKKNEQSAASLAVGHQEKKESEK